MQGTGNFYNRGHVWSWGGQEWKMYMPSQKPEDSFSPPQHYWNCRTDTSYLGRGHWTCALLGLWQHPWALDH
jgi:hypothetical protein